MCLSIAPDCVGGAGVPYVPVAARQLEPEIKPIIYEPEPRQDTTTQPNLGTLTEDDARKRLSPHSRNRFFDTNDSNHRWPNRILTTPEPVWQVANSFSINSQYSPTTSTDSGIKSIHFKDLLLF